MRAALVAVMVLVSACTGDAAVETTTTSIPPVPDPTTTSTSEIPTTTSEAARPVSICGRARLWEPGVVYTAPCFIIPNSFEVSEEGWRSALVQDRFVHIPWIDPSDSNVDQAFEVGVAVTAVRTRDDPAAKADSILTTEGIVPFSDRTPTVVVGLQGIVFDVEGLPREDLGGRQCQQAGSVVLLGRDEFGYVIASGPQDADFFGVGRCQVVRVWVLEAGDYLITIIGGTADPARHEDAIAKVEELFEGMTLEAIES